MKNHSCISFSQEPLTVLRTASVKATPPGARLTPLLRICLYLSRQPSQISSAEESLLPPQFVLFDEKSGGATVQQSLRGIALRKLYVSLNKIRI